MNGQRLAFQPGGGIVDINTAAMEPDPGYKLLDRTSSKTMTVVREAAVIPGGVLYKESIKQKISGSQPVVAIVHIPGVSVRKAANGEHFEIVKGEGSKNG